MAKKNVMCIERLYSDELMHAETSAAKRNYEGAKKNWKRFINDRNNSDDYKTAVDEYMRKNGPKMLREEGSTETIRQQRKPYAKVEKKYKKSGGSGRW